LQIAAILAADDKQIQNVSQTS